MSPKGLPLLLLLLLGKRRSRSPVVVAAAAAAVALRRDLPGKLSGSLRVRPGFGNRDCPAAAAAA